MYKFLVTETSINYKNLYNVYERVKMRGILSAVFTDSTARMK